MARLDEERARLGRAAAVPHVAPDLWHPLFLSAVVALALNDHWLKGAGVLPAAVTGKVSDIAGLLVLPTVVAWLGRIRGPRGWLAIHLLVAVGFSALQLEPVALALEEGSRGLGAGVRLWADPTDLFTLPALVVSYRFLSHPRARPGLIPRPIVGGLALLLCTATSAPGSGVAPRYPFPPAGVLRADVWLRHTGSNDLRVEVRSVREPDQLACSELLRDPVVALEEVSFSEPRPWTLARGDAVPLWDRRGGAVDSACYAVLLKVDDREWFVVWLHGAPAVRGVDIRLEPDEAPSNDALRFTNGYEEVLSAPSDVVVRRRP